MSLHQDLRQAPDETLVESIRQRGLLRAPLVQKESHDTYLVVGGAKRIQALLLTGERRVPCMVLDERLSCLELLVIAARDQSETASLSPIETARLMKHLQQLQLQGPASFKAIRPFLAERNPGYNERLVKLLSLELPIREALHNGGLTAKSGLELCTWPERDRLFLCNLFVRLNMGGNKQLRIIELSRIITTRDQQSLPDLFGDRFGYCLEPTATDNPPQCVNRLLQDLYLDSHPLLSNARESFQSRISELHLPSSCRVEPSVSFEQDRVKLTVEFASLAHLESIWPHLSRVVTASEDENGKNDADQK